MNKQLMYSFIIVVAMVLDSAFAQETQGEAVDAQIAATPTVEANAPKDVISQQTTSIVNPFDMRDPFKRNLPKRGRLKKNLGNKFFNGQMYTNIDSIDGVPLEQIRVVGVLLGSNRRAIVKLVDPAIEAQLENDPNAVVAQDTRTFVVKEGMKLGIDGAEVRAILPGGIVLVEKIRNVYDQDEYLETIIPVSEQKIKSLLGL